MALRLQLERLPQHEHGTFGTLTIPGYTFFTCEPRDTMMPPGVYPIQRSVFHKMGDLPTFEIVVPGHDRVLFHPGNTEEDTHMCVLLGLSLGIIRVEHDEETGKPNKKIGVIQSRVAFERFMERMVNVQQAELEVHWFGQ